MTSPGRRGATRVPGVPLTGRSFGEEGGQLTYGGYLRLAELLAQQVPQADPPAHDELLFITVHQVYELWFQQLLYELEAVRDAMMTGETWRARHLLRRVHAIERLLVAQVDILETMTPQDFLEFRASAGAGQRLPVGAVPGAGVPLRRQGPRVPRPVPRPHRHRARPAGAPPRRAVAVGRVPVTCLPRADWPAGTDAGDPGRRCGWSRATAPPTTTSGSSPRTCSPTTSWPGLWRARHVRDGGAADRHEVRHRWLDRGTVPAQDGCRCGTTRCCGSCGITCRRGRGSGGACQPGRQGSRTDVGQHGRGAAHAAGGGGHGRRGGGRGRYRRRRPAALSGGLLPARRPSRTSSRPARRGRAMVAAEHARLAARRPQGRALVQVHAAGECSPRWRTSRGVVDIVTDDMPFLVDSITMELDPAQPGQLPHRPPAARGPP